MRSKTTKRAITYFILRIEWSTRFSVLFSLNPFWSYGCQMRSKRAKRAITYFIFDVHEYAMFIYYLLLFIDHKALLDFCELSRNIYYIIFFFFVGFRIHAYVQWIKIWYRLYLLFKYFHLYQVFFSVNRRVSLLKRVISSWVS